MIIQPGGQTIAMDRTTEIAPAGANWKIKDMAKSAMSEESEVTQQGLAPVKRTIKQGPATIDVTYTADNVSGTMAMNGNSRPINAKADGTYFADGAGAPMMLATLALKEGYSTTYRNFHLMKQQTMVYTLTVVGKESVTVPAGTFEAKRLSKNGILNRKRSQ